MPTSSMTAADRFGRDAARRRVDRQLADRDAHAADAPVADAEDGPGVGRHDQVEVAVHSPVARSDSSISSGWSADRYTPRGLRYSWL